MDKQYNIRPIRVEDYEILVKWWDSYDHVEVPTSEMLPDRGLGGLALEKDGRLMAAAYIYLTNSCMGYIDFLISDPNYKGRDRFKMITMLIDSCSRVAYESGCTYIWAMTSYEGVVKRCEKLGYDLLGEKYHVIYTHHKIHDDVVKEIQNKNKK